jgi:acid phosphatase family membrane protein YuiD
MRAPWLGKAPVCAYCSWQEVSMASSIIFDSLAYAKRLEDAGFTRQQAEAQANMMTEIVDEKLATKQDLRELELRLTIRVGGMLAASVALLSALITFVR